MHILPVCSSVSCTKRSEAANADLYGNAAEREQSLTYKLCRSSLDAAAAVRRSIFAPFRRVAQHACGSVRLASAHPIAERTPTATPSGGAVLYVALLLAFFSHPPLSLRGGVSGDWSLQRASEEDCWHGGEGRREGGKERKEERCIEADAFNPGRGSWCVSCKGKGKRKEGRMEGIFIISQQVQFKWEWADEKIQLS